MTWQPVTHSDQTDTHGQAGGLPFTLSDADRANAAAARYYIQQHVRHVNTQDAAMENNNV